MFRSCAGDWCFIQVLKTILEALAASGIRGLVAEDFSSSSPAEMIERADLVIADLTDANPYIFYELGVADGLRKPVLLIAQKASKSAGDFVGHRLVSYGVEEAGKLSDFLKYWVRDALESSLSRSYPRP